MPIYPYIAPRTEQVVGAAGGIARTGTWFSARHLAAVWRSGRKKIDSLSLMR